MNILYYSVHQILEDDECRLFQQLGHNVICLGANGKNGSVQAFRPAIEFSPAEVALYDKFAELGGKFVYGADITSTIIPSDFMDFIDVTVVIHDPHFITRFWDTICAKPVVWRTIGQGIDLIDAMLLPHRAAGLKIVRYSPMEQNFAGNIGQDALIRFGKSSQVYSGWVGDTAQVLTFANFFSHRYPLDFADYCEIVSGLPAALGGGGNDGVANAIGTVSWDKQVELLQRSRAYLYASGGHIPYTLNFMEAWITGIPVVVYSPKERQGVFFEIDRMIENGVDGYICRSIEEARYWLGKLLEDESLAARIGRAGRLSALKFFGEEAAAQAWQAFFASLSVDDTPRRPIQKLEVAAVQSETKRVFDALALLRPFDIDLEKMYIGNERDGGYVLADSPAADTDVISFGVGPDVTFEVEMAERGHRVFLHDHTVEGVPQPHDRFVFRKVGVCGQRQEGGELTSLDHCLEMAGPLSDRLILKMDIEGWEWDVFSSISPATSAFRSDRPRNTLAGASREARF